MMSEYSDKPKIEYMIKGLCWDGGSVIKMNFGPFSSVESAEECLLILSSRDGVVSVEIKERRNDK
jgi:hypothetical protein